MRLTRNTIFYIGWTGLISFCILGANPMVYPNSNSKDILADCPWRLDPGYGYLPVLIFIKDAGDNINDYDIDYVSVKYNAREIYRKDYNFKVTDNYYNLYNKGDWYDIMEVPVETLPHNEQITLKITIKENGEWYDPDGDTEMDLKTWISDYALPQMPGWSAGDVHFHSHLTDNEFEFGGPVMMAKVAGEAIGLTFITITDHAVDMNATKYGYLMRLCDSLSSPLMVLLPGEEVSAKNYEGHFLHTLVYNQSQHLVGSEISGPGYTREGYYINEILSRMLPDSAFLYIAHPEIGKFRWEIPFIGWSIDRGMTRDHDYLTPGLHGLQLWNTRRQIENWYENLLIGLVKWKGLLAEGRKIFISAGSDAHGDFSYSRLFTSTSYPNPATDWSNAMGRVRTYLYSRQPNSQASLFQAMKEGRSICSDGPLTDLCIIQGTDTARIGDSLIINSPTIKIHLDLISTPEFGRIDSCLLLQGHIFEPDNQLDDYFERTVNLIQNPIYSDSLSFSLLSYLIPGKPYYFRLESNTDLAMDFISYRCYTNPLWVKRIKNDPTDLIPRFTNYPDKVECRLKMESEDWLNIGLFRLESDTLLMVAEYFNPPAGTWVLTDESVWDNLAPVGAIQFCLNDSTGNQWVNDSVLHLSWLPGVDPKDTLEYILKGYDQTRYSYNLIHNSGFDIFDTTYISLPLGVVYDNCKYFPDKNALPGTEMILAASAGWDGPDFVMSPLPYSGTYWISIRCLNQTNLDQARVTFFLNPDGISPRHLYSHTIPADQQWHQTGLRLKPTVDWFKPDIHSWELQWSIGESFESGQAWFDDFEIFPVYLHEFYSCSLRYRISAIHRNKTLQVVDIYDSSSSKIEYPWILDQDYDSLYLHLETADLTGNKAQQGQWIGPLRLDITAPKIDSVEWNVIPEIRKSEKKGAAETLVLSSHDTLTVTASVRDQTSGLDTTQIKLKLLIGLATEYTMQRLSTQGSKWKINLIPSKGWTSLNQDTLRIVIRAADQSGNVASYSLPPLRIESPNRAPKITERIPVDSTLWLMPGDSVRLKVVALDSDRDSLSYRWIINGTTQTGLSNSVLIRIPAQLNHDWLVKVQVTDGFLIDSALWTIRPIISDLATGSFLVDTFQIHLFPNPMTDHLGIQIQSSFSGIMEYSLITMLGTECLKGCVSVGMGDQLCFVDVTPVSSGVYVVIFRMGKQERILKITKIL